MTWKWILRLFIIAAAICLGAAPANWAKAQDRATIVPGMKVLFENDCVRVQYHDVAVGEKVPMHSHPAYVVYTLKPFKARITLRRRNPTHQRASRGGRLIGTHRLHTRSRTSGTRTSTT